MHDSPRQIPLAEIDEGAITRDRLGLDKEPLDELRHSIAVNGLRQPIEVFPLPEPYDGKLYGLIAGYRRFFAYRDLLGLTGQERFAAIPAFVREHKGAAEAMAAMVEENEVRAGISPFERGWVCVKAHRQGIFASIDEAVEKFFPGAGREKRYRIRLLAHVADELDGFLSAPEKLSVRQMERIARAMSGGFADLMRTALDEASVKDHEHQWNLIDPILAEYEENVKKPERSNGPGRPRRILRPRYGLTVRRERTKDGWSLHFTGREATGPLIDLMLDDIERMYAPG